MAKKKEEHADVKHIAFWSELEKSNQDLFKETSKQYKTHQYYELKYPDISPLMIRLDIYIDKNDYEKHGYICLSIMYKKGTTTDSLQKCFTTEELKYEDLRLYKASKVDDKYNVNYKDNWPNAINWFIETIQAVRKILVKEK